MVCKDDILLWFKESASYKRIDVICNILNMCIPFELRFVGTFLETIGKHSYQELRGAELKANNPAEIGAEAAATVAGLSDGIFRRKITLYLSLLHSYNHTCAKTIFDILTRIDLGDILAKSKSNTDGNVLEEMLLLYTMAINHPAFSFEQYACLGKILMQLLEEENLHQPYTQNLIQRIPKPCNYYNTREDIPPINTIPGPPPGIPLAPPIREPIITPKWTPPPPNPPSPHLGHTQESPINSRTGSPVSIQPIHPANRPQNIKSSWRPPFQNRQEITSRKMVNCVDEKDSEISAWRNSGVRIQNGMRPGTRNDLVNCTQQTYCASQLDGLVIDPEAQHHYSSSSESGRSSTSHSPPGTPHTPGRRKSDTNRPRMNGRLSNMSSEVSSSSSSQSHPPPLLQPPHSLPPQPSQQPPPPHIPPIPPSGFSQTSVPLTAAFMTTGAPYNRSMYTYTPQNYRPQFPYQQPNGEIIVQYPYLPFMIPSQMLEPKSCFNCGTSDHKGPDCPEPTMEEITRSGNYQMDYSTPTATPPDCPTDK